MKTAYLSLLVLLLAFPTASAEVDEEATRALKSALEIAGVDPDEMHCPPFFNEDGTLHRDCYCPQPHDPLGLCD